MTQQASRRHSRLPPRGRLLGLALVAALAACRSGGGPAGEAGAGSGVHVGGTSTGRETPRSADRGAWPVRFRDVAKSGGVTGITVCGNPVKNHLLEVNGSGAAVGDYDGDGDDDLYIATAQTTDDWLAGRRPRANALYRNDGGGRFTEVAAQAGVALAAWSNGAYFADIDDDGDLDLFVTTWGPNVLYRNDGNGRFTDITRAAGVAGDPAAWSASAAFGDLDGDGDLDLYVTNYCEYDLRHPPLEGRKTPWRGVVTLTGPLGFKGQADVLYRNDGGGRFTDVTREAGIHDEAKPLFGLGVVMADLDDDGDADIYVANDSCENYLWRNDGGLRFTDVGGIAGVAASGDGVLQAGMGTDAGDYDGDGRLDLFVTNFAADWNTLYRNRTGEVLGPGRLFFEDATFAANLKDSWLLLSWGTKFLDLDGDGCLDLVVANGHIYPEVDSHPELNMSYRQANSVYKNRGDGSFDNVTTSSGPGFAIVESTRGLAWSDLDRDGDVDLVFTNLDAAPSVLVNDGGNAASWISLRLVGAGPGASLPDTARSAGGGMRTETGANREAIGARLAIETGGRRLVREVNPFGSFQSTGSAAVLVGLGDASKVDRLTIRWPGGATEVLTDLPARRFVTIEQEKGVVRVEPPRASW